MSLRHPIEDEPFELRDSWAYLARRWREELTQLWGEFRNWTTEDRKPLPVVVFDKELLDSAAAGSERREQLATSLSRTLGRNEKPRDVVLEFPQSEILRALVQLPRATPWTLRKMIGYELARLSPIEPGRLYFDFKVGKSGASSKQCEVNLRVIKRDVVDDAIAACTAAGLHVSAIQFTDEVKPADWRHFPIERSAFARFLWRRWNVGILAGLAATLAVFLLVAAFAREASWNASIADAVEVERDRALVVERLERKTAMANAVASFVSRQKQAPMFIGILSDVSKLLPDGTWVTELTISGNRVRLEGYSRSASDLIGIFDRSPYFANAEFAAPLTKDDQAKVERFDLSFDVRMR